MNFAAVDLISQDVIERLEIDEACCWNCWTGCGLPCRHAKHKTTFGSPSANCAAYWSQTYDTFDQVPLRATGQHNPGLLLDFKRFVTGRGLLSCIRVGNQPYGILLATAFSKWTYAVSSNAAATAEHRFYDRLFRCFLKILDTQWQSWVEGVIHVDDPTTHGVLRNVEHAGARLVPHRLQLGGEVGRFDHVAGRKRQAVIVHRTRDRRQLRGGTDGRNDNRYCPARAALILI